MSTPPTRVAVWIIAACLVVILSFATGYLLLSSPNGPPADHPINTPEVATTTPPTGSPTPRVEEALPQTPDVPPPVANHTPVYIGRAGSTVPPPTVLPILPMCSFDAIIYDVRINPDQISRFDIDALTKAAATIDTFEKALASLGTSRPLCRAHQSVSLDEEAYIQITSARPATSPAPPVPAGRSARGTERPSPGAIFDLIATNSQAGTLRIQLAVTATISLEAAPNTAASTPPVLRTAQMQQSLTVIPDTPFLIINSDSTTLDPNGKAVLFIARVVLGPPQSPATQPATRTLP